MWPMFCKRRFWISLKKMWNAFAVLNSEGETERRRGAALLMTLTMIAVMMPRCSLSVVSLCLVARPNYGILTQRSLLPYPCPVPLSCSLSLCLFLSLCVSSYLAFAIGQRRASFIARTARIACQFRAYSCSRYPVTTSTTNERNNYPV